MTRGLPTGRVLVVAGGVGDVELDAAEWAAVCRRCGIPADRMIAAAALFVGEGALAPLVRPGGWFRVYRQFRHRQSDIINQLRWE